MRGKKAEVKIGARYGRLVVLKEYRTWRRNLMVWAECDCGKKIKVLLTNLNSSHTISCGCVKNWTAQKAIKRLNRAIQYEIYQMNKHQVEYGEYKTFTDWLEQYARELNGLNGLGGGNGEVGVIEACSMQ